MTDFNRNIIEWCEYDNNIKSKMEEVKTLKSKKDELEKNIVCYINENNLQESVFNISSLDTKLQYHKSSVKESITLKFLENSSRLLKRKFMSPSLEFKIDANSSF